jgi:hypothetical protein
MARDRGSAWPEHSRARPARASGVGGYAHASYPASLSEFGQPRALPESGGWLLERSIPRTSGRDALGCYPLFSCPNWPGLARDLDTLRDQLVSVALVADPFGDHDEAYLRGCFPDLVLPFKQHLVTDLSRPPATFVHAHHQRNVRKALAALRIELCPDPARLGDEWVQLYANLVSRHAVHGISAFSDRSLRAQLTVPGLVVFRAVRDADTVGMTLWYAHHRVAYYHLAAYSAPGYDARASFGLFWRAIEYFADQGFAWLNLGGGAGASHPAPDDGLTRFKRGWATGARTAFFCGRILDRAGYAEAMRANGASSSSYFPAYRAGEFR